MNTFFVKTKHPVTPANLKDWLAEEGINSNCRCQVEGTKLEKLLNQSDDGTLPDYVLGHCELGLIKTHSITVANSVSKEDLLSTDYFEFVELEEVNTLMALNEDLKITDNDEPSRSLQKYLDTHNFPQAWNIFKQNHGNFINDKKVICIVADTGIRASHQDLSPYGVENFTNGEHEHTNSHGTACAGIIAGLDNELGIIGGTAGDCNLYDFKIANSGGAAMGSDINRSLIRAGEIAEENGRLVLYNLSFGPYSLQFSKDAIDFAVSKGVIIFIAAGNSAIELPDTWGAAHPQVFSVAALTLDGKTQAPFSNFGSPKKGGNGKISIWAAGVSMRTTHSASDTAEYSPSGTSFACPLTAAAAALLCEYALQAYNYKSTFKDIEHWLQYGSTQGRLTIKGTEYDTYKLNVGNSLSHFDQWLSKNITKPEPEPQPEPEPENPTPQPTIVKVDPKDVRLIYDENENSNIFTPILAINNLKISTENSLQLFDYILSGTIDTYIVEDEFIVLQKKAVNDNNKAANPTANIDIDFVKHLNEVNTAAGKGKLKVWFKKLAKKAPVILEKILKSLILYRQLFSKQIPPKRLHRINKTIQVIETLLPNTVSNVAADTESGFTMLLISLIENSDEFNN